MPPPRSLPCARNRTPAAGPRPRRRGAAGGPSLAPLFGDLTFFQYLRTHHHHLGVGRRYRRETGSEQGMGPGRRGGGRDRQPLVCTARSLCVRAQCVCAASSPAMPSPSLAASEAAITCAHVLPMEPPLGGGGGRCRRWPAVARYVDDHHVPRRLRAVPRRPRNAEGSHGLAGAAILPDARCESGAKERDDAGRAVGAAPR